MAEWNWLWELDFNPPLYYLLLRPFHLLEEWGVDGALAARLLPLSLEVGFLWWAWGAIRRSRVPHGALWLALWAVAPAAVEATGVGRGYTLLLWLAAIAWTALSARLADPHDRKAGWWLTAALALALLTHYYAGFLVAAMGLRLARRGQIRRLVAWLAPAVAVFLAIWGVPLAIQLSRGNEMIQPLGVGRVARGLASLFSGQVLFLASPGLAAGEIAILLLAAGLGAYLALRGWRVLRGEGGALAWEALCLPLFALLVSAFGLQVWEEYWFLPALPALLWLVVAGVSSLRPAGRRVAALALFAGMLLASVRGLGYAHQEWDQAVAWVGRQGGLGRQVVANIPFDVEALAEATTRHLAEGPAAAALRAQASRQAREWLAGDVGRPPAMIHQLCRRLAGNARIYLVGSFDPEPHGGMLAALDGCRFLERREEWRGRRVFVVAYGAAQASP